MRGPFSVIRPSTEYEIRRIRAGWEEKYGFGVFDQISTAVLLWGSKSNVPGRWPLTASNFLGTFDIPA